MKILGHIFGVGALILLFISYQIHDKKKLLLVQTGATVMVCLQYLCTGADSGFVLNLICIARNFCFFACKKGSWISVASAIFFACAMPVVSVFQWEGYHSLFIIAGLAINTLCLGLCSAQGLRWSILLTSPLVIVYNIFAETPMGVVNEVVVIVASVVGIVRFLRSKREKTSGERPSEE